MNRSYIINDVNGNPINEKYPPNKDIYGDEFGGYRSEAEKILFHDFAVMSMDVSFLHDGTKYFFMCIIPLRQHITQRIKK